MEDPENPLSGSPPPKPSPEEVWDDIIGNEYLHHLSEDSFLSTLDKKEALVMFYAPCKFSSN